MPVCNPPLPFYLTQTNPCAGSHLLPNIIVLHTPLHCWNILFLLPNSSLMHTLPLQRGIKNNHHTASSVRPGAPHIGSGKPSSQHHEQCLTSACPCLQDGVTAMSKMPPGVQSSGRLGTILPENCSAQGHCKQAGLYSSRCRDAPKRAR